MKFNANIFEMARENTYFRQEVATGDHAQVVLMNLLPGEEIGMEVHALDQILIFILGEGTAILDGESRPVQQGSLVYVPSGAEHNFINSGKTDLKLFTVYAPPQHKPGTIHKTKQEAEVSEEHY